VSGTPAADGARLTSPVPSQWRNWGGSAQRRRHKREAAPKSRWSLLAGVAKAIVSEIGSRGGIVRAIPLGAVALVGNRGIAAHIGV
jgi:hypothetical protein